MKRAIGEYVVIGIDTNLEFHKKLLEHPAFVSGEYDTGLIARETKLTEGSAMEEEQKAAVGIAAVFGTQTESPKKKSSAKSDSKTNKVSAWRQRI